MTDRLSESKADAASDGRPDWLTMAADEFGATAPMTQGALFPEPDRMGTPALFGGMFGEDL